MSAYKIVECNVKDAQSIKVALMDMGIPERFILVFDSPKALVGYSGDTRNNKAHVIVRREHINKYLSTGASNDIGFERKNGKFVAHISDYDMSWWKSRKSRFLRAAAAEALAKTARMKGYSVKKVDKQEEIRLVLKRGY